MASAAVRAAAERYDVRVDVALDASSGQPVLAADEGEELSCSCEGVSLHFGDLPAAGPGHLFITTRRVIWSGPEGLVLGMTFPQIVMHAVSKDGSAHPRPCIYLQLDDGSEDMADGADEEEEEEVEAHSNGNGNIASAAMSPEVMLVPEDSSKVEELFKALCSSAALNPDPENEDEGDFFYNESEVMAGLDDATRATLMAQRIEGGAMELNADEELNQLVGQDPGRFDDDDEGEGEEEDEGMFDEEEGQGARQNGATR